MVAVAEAAVAGAAAAAAGIPYQSVFADILSEGRRQLGHQMGARIPDVIRSG